MIFEQPLILEQPILKMFVCLFVILFCLRQVNQIVAEIKQK